MWGLDLVAHSDNRFERLEKRMTKLNEIVVDRKVPSVMSDGTILYSDVYRPKAEGRYPVLVERVPYDLDGRLAPYAEWYASRGYVFVGQNTRGSFWSEGELAPFIDDGLGGHRDGYTTIEWAAAQQWSNGNVGTMDGSWSGYTQNFLAPTRPPHLKAGFHRMAPAFLMQSGVEFLYVRYFAAVLLLSQANHPSANAELIALIPKLQATVSDPTPFMELLPSGLRPFADEIAPKFVSRLDTSPADPVFWEMDASQHASEIGHPIFHLGGWFDTYLPDTLAMYSKIREGGFTEAARESQRMLIGPWVHGPLEPDNRYQADLDFGPNAVLGINEFRKRWFDHWLKGEKNGADEMPPVRLFVMGENQWRDYDSWPPPGTTDTKLFLQRGDPDGALSFEPSQDDESYTEYDYDPLKPTKSPHWTKAFDSFGPFDLSEHERGRITFTSAPLSRPITIVGQVILRLFASSSAIDTDWFAHVTDVQPDGKAYKVLEGALRARYREGLDHEAFLEPGKPYLFEIDMRATAQLFEVGHRIRLSISSSQFPMYGRNLNTGGVNQEETEVMVAHNIILHDQDHPSHLVLPVME
jgi:predicted acyl esterase